MMAPSDEVGWIRYKQSCWRKGKGKERDHKKQWWPGWPGGRESRTERRLSDLKCFKPPVTCAEGISLGGPCARVIITLCTLMLILRYTNFTWMEVCIDLAANRGFTIEKDAQWG
jgi:hypothetical protein